MVKGLILASLLALAACQTVPKGDFCAISKPHRLSAKSVESITDAERASLLEHNKKGQRLCGWVP